ncbi:hypothetical protein AMAG_20677 [Allomyces macrogynus ATCC 38327]|uniref:Uncharacterized protein n=1 Tax=Allomyces macrogynus (strain ATCC 38327) TaxID=578462 RepID=A0A0L0TEK8_ALLM3|nr:hypothetical protein AMAG_20677 [Allomyces macrogynus ATCC 38327]|eukprot:KNE73130.1 hypothetical protein AMAG_20677 [Allomyces macrogynus ATCC 38327]
MTSSSALAAAAAAAAAGSTPPALPTSSHTPHRFAFNQDGDCVCVAYEARIAVFSFAAHGAPKLKSHFAVTQAHAPVHAATMLHKTNILALLAGARRKKVKLYDDRRRRAVLDVEYPYPVARCVLRRDTLVATTVAAVHVHRLPTRAGEVAAVPLFERPLAATAASGGGLLAVSSTVDRLVVVTDAPSGPHRGGHVQILDLTPLLAVPPVKMAVAANVYGDGIDHDSSDLDDHFSDAVTSLPSSPDMGTVHVFHVPKTLSTAGTPTQGRSRHASVAATDLRLRSTSSSSLPDPAVAAAWQHVDATTTAIAAGSDGDDQAWVPVDAPTDVGAANPRSQLAFLTPILPAYFASEWAFATFHVPLDDDPRPQRRRRSGSGSAGSATPVAAFFPRRATADELDPPVDLTVCFVRDADKALVTSTDGRMWRFAFDAAKGGEGVLDGMWRVVWPEDPARGPFLDEF